MKLSYIIPVYNVKKWLRRCVESCMNQRLASDEYEILLVDDGSTDGSSELCDELQNETPSVIAIHIKNKGASGARNEGLKVAKGDYVWFVDSDDFIEPNCAKQLVDFAIDNVLDVLGFNLYITVELEGQKTIKKRYHIRDLSGGEVLNGEQFISLVDMPPSPWCTLYRREFLNRHDLRFFEGIYYEDQEFPPRAFYFSKRASFYNNNIYNYVQRCGSIMKSSGQEEKRSKDWLTVADSIYFFMKQYIPESSPAYAVFVNKINFDFTQSLRYCNGGAQDIAAYKSRPYYPLQLTNTMSVKEKLKYRFINFSIGLYLFVHHLYAHK